MINQFLRFRRNRAVAVATAPELAEKNLGDAERLREVIVDARSVQETLRNFVSRGDGEKNFVSLGQNCSTAWYLKQLGLKRASYPFDWVFSSGEIIRDCIEDEFSAFLNRRHYTYSEEGSTGHAIYHGKLFNHRDPGRSREDYQYYKRCCDRFTTLIKSRQDVVYVATLINEPQKRIDWSSGFGCSFEMPACQTSSTIAPLIKLLRSKGGRAQFVVIDQRTDGKVAIKSDVLEDDLVNVRFESGGSSTGVRYVEAFDDFIFKLALCGMC